MPAEENKTIVCRVMDEAWNQGNLAAIDELYAADYVDHAPGHGGPGREGVKRTIQMFRSAFPDLRGTLEDLIAEGDKVAFRYTAAGTHQGDLMGIAPTGKRVSMDGIAIVRIANGKIMEGWGGFDALGLLRQLGAVSIGGQVGALGSRAA